MAGDSSIEVAAKLGFTVPTNSTLKIQISRLVAIHGFGGLIRLLNYLSMCY